MGSPCGCWTFGHEISTSVKFSMGSPPVVAELLVVKFLQVFNPVGTVALPIFICIQMQLHLALVWRRPDKKIHIQV